MKNLILKSVFILSLVLLSSCNIDDDASCSPIPAVISFEFLDPETNDNLYLNGTYSQQDLEIKTEDGQDVNYDFIAQGTARFIRMALRLEDGNQVVIVSLDDETDVTMNILVESLTQGNCTQYFVENLDIPGYTYEINQETNTVQIKAIIPTES